MQTEIEFSGPAWSSARRCYLAAPNYQGVEREAVERLSRSYLLRAFGIERQTPARVGPRPGLA